MGDLLSLTPVVDYYSKVGDVTLICSNKNVFNNFDIKIINPEKNKFLKIFLPILNSSLYSNIIGAFELPINMNKKKVHLREALLSKRPDVCKKISKVEHNVIIKFNDKEIREFSKKYKELLKTEYGLIISGSFSGGLCQVKNWGPKNMQKIVDATYEKINWIQTGTKDEPRLNKSFLDLRGKTNLREIFFLVSKSKLIVTTEGFLTHISSAFDIPCITTYSGYHYPEISLYDNIIPIQPYPLPKCAYCWNSPCLEYNDPICLKNIRVENVLKEANRVLNIK